MPWSDPVPHLLVALIAFETAGVSRREVMESLAAQGVGSQVHYIPVHTQPYWRTRNGERSLPGAEAWYRHCLSLPLFPAMEDGDVVGVADALRSALRL